MEQINNSDNKHEQEKSASQLAVEKADKEGKLPVQFLQLGIKQEGGGVKSTGLHTVRFLHDKEGKVSDPITKQEKDGMKYLFEEKGIKVRYEVPLYNKEGDKIHYFVLAMSRFKSKSVNGIGDVLTLEMKKSGLKNYIEIVGSDNYDDIPIIEDGTPNSESESLPEDNWEDLTGEIQS